MSFTLQETKIMHISISWFADSKYPSFNLELASAEGRDPFLTIKSCSLREHNGKEFVSFPSKKLDTGKYWNHVYASDDFQRVVLEKAKESRPAKTATPEKKDTGMPMDMDDDLPF